MTDRDVRRKIVWASVVFVSALTIAASFSIIARVDRERAAQLVRPVAPPETPRPPSQQLASNARPPVTGLLPAPTPRRRVVAVRRTRAS